MKGASGEEGDGMERGGMRRFQLDALSATDVVFIQDLPSYEAGHSCAEKRSATRFTLFIPEHFRAEDPKASGMSRCVYT